MVNGFRRLLRKQSSMRVKAAIPKMQNKERTHDDEVSPAPLFDTRAYTRDLERAFACMWEVYRSAQSPQHLVIGSVINS